MINNDYNSVVKEFKKIIDPTTYTGKILEQGGIPEVLRYLKNLQPYSIATTGADWGVFGKDSIFLGKLGHHCFIILPGHRICEWTPTKTNLENTVLSQEEQRFAMGKAIEKLWNLHLKFSPSYHTLGNLWDNNNEGYLHYFPFKNDCFSYVNRLLRESNLLETHLNRIFIENAPTSKNQIIDTEKVISLFNSIKENIEEICHHILRGA